MSETAALLGLIRRLHERIRTAVLEACAHSGSDELARCLAETAGDVIYAVDRVSEEVLLEYFAHEVAPQVPVVLIAEGLPGDGRVVLPEGTAEADARYRVIVDPIDGTRVLMYQKRSAWILTGVAPNRGPQTGLADIELAVQTEIPLIKQHLADQVWAVRDQGWGGERANLLTGQCLPLTLHPAREESVMHGFATVSRFFPGARDVLAAIDDELITRALGPLAPGSAPCFEDQYTSTGGQLFGLLSGQDRFVADLRALLGPVCARRGQPLGHCCHPYDLCTELIARQAGVIVTDGSGHALNAPLDVTTDVAWAGYANPHIRAQIQPHLLDLIRTHGLGAAPT